VDDAFDSQSSCPQCGCKEVGWSAPMLSLMAAVARLARSCRACGWVYLITPEEVECEQSSADA
jgi:rubredoxin